MAKRHSSASSEAAAPIYWGAAVPLRAIRRFASAVGKKFRPDAIILFGSHAYGVPHGDSDVDILVVMPARSKHSQAVRIRRAVPAPFPMDLLVRTPDEMQRALSEGDTFLCEIVSKGKILYENGDSCMGAQGRSRFPRCKRSRRKQAAPA
jgi:predicted nucleotidyltransferase